MKTYRLPNGDYSASAQEYSEAWDKLFTILEKSYNLEVIAFDPGIQVKQKIHGITVLHFRCGL